MYVKNETNEEENDAAPERVPWDTVSARKLWKANESTVGSIPKQFTEFQPGSTVRVWSPGVGTVVMELVE